MDEVFGAKDESCSGPEIHALYVRVRFLVVDEFEKRENFVGLDFVDFEFTPVVKSCDLSFGVVDCQGMDVVVFLGGGNHLRRAVVINVLENI